MFTNSPLFLFAFLANPEAEFLVGFEGLASTLSIDSYFGINAEIGIDSRVAVGIPTTNSE